MRSQQAGPISRRGLEPPPDAAAIQALLQRAGVAATEAEIRTAARMLARLAPPAGAQA
ncbi:MAG TPA: hypothetical protein VEA17_11975 [Bordetella sp.]|nr:hypothetical protein [Bordetella sp.]